MVANCTLLSSAHGRGHPRLLETRSNQWPGQVEVQIQEGVTVREGQTLFDLPDPKRMWFKA